MKPFLFVDQTDKFLSILRLHFGTFSVIENPITGVSWPAETIVRITCPVLWKFEDQLDVIFRRDPLEKLSFRPESKDMFIDSMFDLGIDLNRNRPN